MAKRKPAIAAETTHSPDTITSPQPPEIAAVLPPDPPQLVSEQSRAEQQPRPLLADPFAFKTVNLGGYKVHFQHSRQAREFQIRFGDGSRNDMPSDAVRDFIKSHKVQVETANGPAEVNLFRWNENDRAWGMQIPFDRAAPEEENKSARETARQTAKNIFEEVVKLVGEERRTVAVPSADNSQGLVVS
jgi:hypothetical protein